MSWTGPSASANLELADAANNCSNDSENADAEDVVDNCSNDLNADAASNCSNDLNADAVADPYPGYEEHNGESERPACACAFDRSKHEGWVITTANTTSLWTQSQEVFELPGKVIAMQETWLTLASQEYTKKKFEDQQWSIAFGAPLEEKNTIWHCSTGGVAIAAGTPLQKIEPSTDVEKRLLATTRYVHAVSALGDGRQVVHIICVYGHSGAQGSRERMRENEALLEQTFQVAAGLGNTPVFVVGDLNIDPDASPAIQNAVRHGSWTDCAKACASAGASQPDPTCFVRDTSAGTRIDAVLCNACAKSAVVECGVVEDCAMPTHRPIACRLGLQEYDQLLKCIRRPQAVPLDF